MKKKILFLMLGFLLIAGNLYAAGDLIVEGKVGVGTSSPNVALTVRDSGNEAFSFGYPGAGTGVIGEHRIRYDGSGIVISADHTNINPSAYLDLSTGGVGRLRVAKNGNIGIGTTAPDVLLDVYGESLSGNGTMRVTNTNSGTREVLVLKRNSGDGGASFVLDNSAGTNGRIFEFFTTDGGNFEGAGKLIIFNNFTANLTIDEYGNIGIGTTDPTAKLEVAGNAGTDGIKLPDGTLITTANDYLMLPMTMPGGTSVIRLQHLGSQTLGIIFWIGILLFPQDIKRQGL